MCIFIEANCHLFNELTDGGEEFCGQVLVETADAHIVVEHPLSGEHFEEIVDFFSFTEHIDEWGKEGAAIIEEGADGYEVTGDPLQFRQHHPHIFGTFGNFDAAQFLSGENIRQVITHRSHIIEAVG